MEFSEEKASKLESNVIKSLNDLNNKLHTNLTFFMVLEEISFLKKIPTNKGFGLRVDHLNQVIKRWYTGLLAEHRDSASRLLVKRHTVEKVQSLYNAFVRSLFEYLYYIGVLAKKNNGGKDNSELTDETKSNDVRSAEIGEAIILVDAFKKQLNLSSLAYDKEENESKKEVNYEAKNEKSLIEIDESTIKETPKVKDNNQFVPKLKIDYDYYGPSVLYPIDPFIQRLVETFNEESQRSDINYVDKVSYIKVNDNPELEKAHKLLIDAKAYKYRFDQLEGERKRLFAERMRLEANENSLDFFFDSFIWRLLNDMFYLIGSSSNGGKRTVFEVLNENIITNEAPQKENVVVVDINDIVKDEIENVVNNEIIEKQIEEKEISLEEATLDPIMKK